MSWLSSAVSSLCFCAVAVGIIEMLVPENSFKNQMRLVTGAVLIISMFTPFLSGISFDISLDNISADVDVSSAANASVARAVKDEISVVLSKYEIENAKISVTTGEDENKSIIVTEASILCDEKDKTACLAAESEIEDKLNIDVKTGVIT